IVVILLDVLAVVAFAVGQAEKPLLEERIAPIPKRDRHAEVLKPVAEPGKTVFVPPVGSAASVVVREVIPGVAVRTVILTGRAPGPLGQIGSPVLPVGASRLAFDQAIVFSGRSFGPGHWESLRP